MKELLDLYITWFKMSIVTFGGGYAMLPMIQREVIEKKHWASEEEILDYYAIGQCTPGIIAVNTATFVGYYQKGVIGGIVATLGVVSPSFIIILLIAAFLKNFLDIPIVISALKGINVGVCVLMTKAIINLWKKSIYNIGSFIIFFLALILALFSGLDTVYLVIIAAILGIVFARLKLIKVDE